LNQNKWQTKLHKQIVKVKRLQDQLNQA